MSSRKESSPPTIAHLKIVTTCAHSLVHIVMSSKPSIYKMGEKLKKESLQCLFLLTPCWHIDAKTCLPNGENIRKPLQLERKIFSQESNAIKAIFRLSHNCHNNPTRKSSPQNQINLNVIDDDNVCQHANSID